MPTEQQVEAAAKAIFCTQNSIMHDHEANWLRSDKCWLYRECAKAALLAAERCHHDEGAC